jgi:A/G-specific adenine glycosylase
VDAYPRFLSRFPSAASLAAASEAEVLSAWSGLGYNRRALALRRTAAAIVAAGWPRDVAGLERLPGIGPYTARALAGLAFGAPVGVVDTNVRRWLVRRLGLDPRTPLRRLQELADGLAVGTDDGREDAWIHASMEFGATICRSRRPLCTACPIARGCPARGLSLPVPVARQARFAGSDRAHRGRLLREMSGAADHSVGLASLRRRLGPSDLNRIIDGLERDGLAHRAGRRLRLGGAATPGGAATIDA